MKKIIDYFVEHSLVTNLITLMILLMGLFSLFTLKRESFPNVEFDLITVRAAYVGASAEDIEKLVTIPLERVITQVEGIETLNAMSAEGFSLLSLKVDPSYKVDEVLDEVRNALEGVTDLPEDVDTPVAQKIDRRQRSIIYVALTQGSEEQRRFWAKKLRDDLEKLSGVSRVNMDGYRDSEIEIGVDPQKMARHDLTLQEVSSALIDKKRELSLGQIKGQKSDINLRFSNEMETAEDFQKVILRSNDSGHKIWVSDIAKVEEKLVDPNFLYRAWGEEAIFLEIKGKADSDIIRTTDEVKEQVENFWDKNQIKDLKYVYADEAAFYVRRRLNVLVNNGLQGLGLVFIALLLFMNFRVSLMTSLGAPISFLVAFAAMEYFGFSLNLISMFGLILVLGMLVDDSIIVAENFYQYIEKGLDPKTAAKRAAKETLAPVTATILTTLVAFGSIFFMGGIMGKFMWPVPTMVIVCLIASWVECFFILPGHLADFTKAPKKEDLNKKRWYHLLLNLYKKTLNLFLRFPVTTVLAFIALFFFSVFLAKDMRKELFPGDDVRILFFNAKGPLGISFKQTNEVLHEMEHIIKSQTRENEVEMFKTIVGWQQSMQGTPRTGNHYGSIILYLSTSDLRDRSVDEIMKSINDQISSLRSDYIYSIEKANLGPPKGKPINIELSGDKLEELKMVANQIKEKVLSLKGVLSSELDFEDGKTQYIFQIDEQEAKRLGVNSTSIALELRAAFAGAEIGEVRKLDEDVEIYLRLQEEFRNSPEALKAIFVKNSQGRRIALDRVTKRLEKSGAYIIRRLDRKRTIAVIGSIDLRQTTALEANKEIEPYIQNLLKDYPEMDYDLAGENKDTEESMMRLGKSALISFLCIFIILVVMFSSLIQPLIIMSAIPLGLIGVVLTFIVMGLPISFMAGMGIIALVGVVVNDSIVLVSFINTKMEESRNHLEAILEASVSRFRPVILTTFTTVAGLLPMAHTPGGDPFLKPMAISFAYGLMFSTSLTLVFVPCSYLIYAKIFKRKEN